MPAYITKQPSCSRAGGRLRRVLAVGVVVLLTAASFGAMVVAAGVIGRPAPRPAASATARLPTDVAVIKPDVVAAFITGRDRQMYRFIFDWLETPTFSCGDLRAVGSESVCFDAPLAPVTTGCLVYSVGVGADWSFERQMAARGCEVHLFDPTAPMPEGAAAAGIRFYPWEVASKSIWIGERLRLTLADIMTELGHTDRRIQFLKVHDDNAAMRLLLDQMTSSKNRFVLDQVDQISIALRLPIYMLQHDLRINMEYDLLETALGRAGEVGIRLVRSTPFDQVRYWFPGVERAVHSSYHLLMVRTGRDTLDRIDRNQKNFRLLQRTWS
ncbi:uncharacterized protein LOC119099412 [Pollicipes pollicipes]|uniref:uncharacterized protein LOC119099412 n=1 Tax=Pollicipes pollicipes TaxID=41117 RepID=UPI00188554CE|nr:uncharacterized protein LOC119099412 [Pollicipes pollicipes]